MPPVSQAQRGAMYSAAAGKSTLGIPKSVGAEFVAADKPGKLPKHVGHDEGGAIEYADPHHPIARVIAGLFGQPMGDEFRGLFGKPDPADPDDPRRPPNWSTPVSGGIGADADRAHLQSGGGEFGGLGAANPWWERAEARKMYDQPFGGGFIGSSGAGRTDQIPLSVAADSHVITADVMSGLGQGNGLHGARVLNEALRIGPYGSPLPAHVRGPGPPHPPAAHLSQAAGGGLGHNQPPEAPKKTSILVAGGEYVVPEHDWVGEDEHGHLQVHRGVRSLGEGDHAKGHKHLDNMMHFVRKHVRKFLDDPPPPKK